MWRWYYETDGMYNILNVRLYPPENTSELPITYSPHTNEYQDILLFLLNEYKQGWHFVKWWNDVQIVDTEDVFVLDFDAVISNLRVTHPEEFI